MSQHNAVTIPCKLVERHPLARPSETRRPRPLRSAPRLREAPSPSSARPSVALSRRGTRALSSGPRAGRIPTSSSISRRAFLVALVDLDLPLREAPVPVAGPVDEKDFEAGRTAPPDEPAGCPHARLRPTPSRPPPRRRRHAVGSAAPAVSRRPAAGPQGYPRQARFAVPGPGAAARIRASATTASWCSPAASWKSFAAAISFTPRLPSSSSNSSVA